MPLFQHSTNEAALTAARLQLLNQSMQIDNLTMHNHYLQQEIHATRAEYETIRSELNECQMQSSVVDWATQPSHSRSKQQSDQQWSAWLATWKPYLDTVTDSINEAADTVQSHVQYSKDQAQQWFKGNRSRSRNHSLTDQLQQLRDKYLKPDGKRWKKQRRHLKRSLKQWASQLADNYSQVKDTTASILADSAEAMSKQSMQLLEALHSMWSTHAPTTKLKNHNKRSKRH